MFLESKSNIFFITRYTNLYFNFRKNQWQTKIQAERLEQEKVVTIG